ncbi:MAG: hypothetical protein U1F51_03995 [Burkholderiales bacterium]
MTKKAEELARLRQTCCLGLASEIVVPQIVEDLHRLIESERVHFAWSDELGNIVNAYFEKPDPATLDWLRQNQRRFEEEVGVSVRQSILFGKPTGNYRWPYRAGFEGTESYARLFGGLGLRYSLDGVVRDRFRPLGQVVLFRRTDDPDFSVEEEERLAQTLPYIAHAIAGPQKTPEAFVETGDSGLLVFDAAGRISFQSAQAKELILYALHEQIPVGGTGEGLSLEEVERGLSALHAQVVKIHEQPAPPARRRSGRCATAGASSSSAPTSSIPGAEGAATGSPSNARCRSRCGCCRRSRRCRCPTGSGRSVSCCCAASTTRRSRRCSGSRGRRSRNTRRRSTASWASASAKT